MCAARFSAVFRDRLVGVRDASNTASSPRPGATVTVQLLAINDLHGNLEPPSGSNGRINAVEAGGTEYLATHVKNAIAQQPNSIVVAAGDLVGASPIASSMFHDEPTIEALNPMGLASRQSATTNSTKGTRSPARLRPAAATQRTGARTATASTARGSSTWPRTSSGSRPGRRCFRRPRFGPSAASRSDSSARRSPARARSCPPP